MMDSDPLKKRNNMYKNNNIWRLVILLTILPFLYMGIDYSLRHIAILPGFLELEKKEAEKDLLRCINAILREQHHMKQQALDWAEFDDMYEFVKDKNNDFEKANLLMEELSRAGIDVIYIVDANGDISWKGGYDRIKENEITLKELPESSFGKKHPLLFEARDSQGGILLTEHAPLIVAPHPILPTSGEGEARGTLIMGKFIFQDIIADLKDNIRINFSAASLLPGQIKEETRQIVQRLDKGRHLFQEQNQHLVAYAVINDIYNTPALLIKATLDRTILERGRKTALFASINILVVFTFVLFFALLWLKLFRGKLEKERKQIEALVDRRTVELQESELRFSALSDAAFDAIFLSEQGICILQNKTAEKMFGYTNEEATGRKGTEWIVPVDRQRVMLAMTSNSQSSYFVTALRKDGSTFPAEIQGRPAVYKGKKVRITSLRDITARKKNEKEKALLENKLRQLQRMESIGQMAGGVAHDLNNILSGIVVYPEILLAQLPPDSNLRPPLEATKKAGLRAADVVSDLLTVARGVSSIKDVADLNCIITEYLQSPEYQTLHDRHCKVEIGLDLSPTLANLKCSPIHIRKCIMNLVINGCEAIEGEGNILIKTSGKNIEQKQAKELAISPGHYICLQIKDNGTGISKENIEHIFEPFYTKKAMGKSGTGLGLTVVWNTVQDHAGAARVTSDSNGTTFELLLPSTTESVENLPQAQDIEALKGNSEKILIVDDDPQQRDIAFQLLQTLNYRPSTVSSGEDALLFLKSKDVDLVILDMLMEPGINGAETYLRIHEEKPHQKALIVSGFSKNQEIENAQRLGIEIFIKKPYTLEQIGNAVKDALKQKQ